MYADTQCLATSALVTVRTPSRATHLEVVLQNTWMGIVMENLLAYAAQAQPLKRKRWRWEWCILITDVVCSLLMHSAAQRCVNLVISSRSVAEVHRLQPSVPSFVSKLLNRTDD